MESEVIMQNFVQFFSGPLYMKPWSCTLLLVLCNDVAIRISCVGFAVKYCRLLTVCYEVCCWVSGDRGLCPRSLSDVSA